MGDSTAQRLRERLCAHGQEHLLRWWDELSPDEQAALGRQIEAVDFALIEKLLADSKEEGGETPQQRARRAEPPRDLVRLPTSADAKQQWRQAEERGRELLESGRVGVVLVAGGQGTRLDFDHAKGMYPIGPVSGKSLFGLLAEQVLAVSRRFGVRVPYCIMTSDATHEETVAFFREQGCFGLLPDDVYFFRQGNMPAADDESGRLLLAEKGRLAVSPDGHGGMLQALAKAGLLRELRDRGADYLYYHQVDNPTVIVCDPAFLGFHVLRNSELTTKVVAKRSAEEKMGVVVDVDGRTELIEYSDMPDDVAARTDDSGELLHWAGSTAIHVFDRAFLQRLIDEGLELPFHRAHKKVEHIDENGKRVQPEKPNAYKFERFIFDALPHAGRTLVVEADRSREFNPVKNAEGDDSPQTAKAAMTRVFREWLQQAGARLPDDVPVEVSPLFALDSEELKEKMEPGRAFDGPVYLA